MSNIIYFLEKKKKYRLIKTSFLLVYLSSNIEFNLYIGGYIS